MTNRRGRPDLRRVRRRTTYTALEAADLLGVAVGTIRSWLREGLPALDDGRPVLILGSDLKTWLSERSAARKCKCAPDEMYCLRCRGPRKPRPGTAEIVPRNRKTLRVTGGCDACGAPMNRAGSVAKIQEIVEAFGLRTIRQEHLAGCDIPLVKHDLEKEPVE